MRLSTIFTLCLVLCSGFIQGFYDLRHHGSKNQSVFTKGVKRLEGMLVNEGGSGRDKLKDELIQRLTNSFRICKRGIDEAADKVNVLLDLISLDEISEVEKVRKPFYEGITEDSEDDLDERPMMDVVVEDFSDLNLLRVNKLVTEQELYIEDLKLLLETFSLACSSLPTVLPTMSNRKERNSQQIAQKLAFALKNWGEKWLGEVETQLDVFLVNCFKSKTCERYIHKMFNLFTETLKERKYKLDEDTISALKELQQLPKNNPSIETLNDMQRLALIIDNPFDPFKEDDSSYNIAGAVNGLEKERELLETQNGLNSVSLISNLLRYPPVRKAEKAAIIEIEESNLVTTLPSTFLSLAFGSSLIEEKWGQVKPQKEKFKKIASALSPAVLRVGGSAANFLTYDPSLLADPEPSKSIFQNSLPYHGKHPKAKIQDPDMDYLTRNIIPKAKSNPKKGGRNQFMIDTNKINSMMFFDIKESRNCESELTDGKIYHNFTMTGSDWNFLIDLVRDLKWEVVFDLNQFLRDPQGNWDPSNAKLIINDPKSLTVPIIWQLGNEPNAYRHKFNWSISPEEAAEDYRELARVLSESSYPNRRATIIGLDVTRPKHLDETLNEDSMAFLRKFLETGTENIDVLTWHQYYFDGKTATLDDFLSSEILNAFPLELGKIVATRDLLAPEKPIWITETASAWGGGAPGLSNRFVACFPWLDKLGSAALGGASQVFRQTLYGGCYSLLDHELNPYPDFWVSVLHKHLVGERVLLPRVRLANNSTRIYAHCLKANHHMFQKGAVTIFGMNLSNEKERLNIMGEKFKKTAKFLYEFSASHNDLRSRNILLNGNLLQISDDGSLPEFVALEIKEEDLIMKPHTLNFWVFPDADVKVCY